MELRPYQKVAVKHLLSDWCKLLLDDMGVGKSQPAIVAADHAYRKKGHKRNKKIIIFCPPSIRWQWVDYFHAWTMGLYNVQTFSSMTDWVKKKTEVIVCPYNYLNSPMIYDQLKAFDYVVGIADEVHFLKNSKSERTNKVIGKKAIFKKCDYKWGLSGSIMPNRPIELYTLLMTLGRKHLGKYDNWMSYTKHFCQRYRTKYDWDVSGASNMSELRKIVFGSGLALRRTLKSIGIQIPDKQVRFIAVEGKEISDNQLLKRIDINKKTLGIPGNELAETRKNIGLSKVKPVAQYVCDKLEGTNNRKICLFAWHQEVIESLMLLLKEFNPVSYYGKTQKKRKEVAKKQFIEDPSCRIFIGNIGSAGVGLDKLQQVCNYAIFAEIEWSPEAIKQAIHRLYRSGQKKKVIADIPVIRRGVEEYILSKMLSKNDNIKELLK